MTSALAWMLLPAKELTHADFRTPADFRWDKNTLFCTATSAEAEKGSFVIPLPNGKSLFQKGARFSLPV